MSEDHNEDPTKWSQAFFQGQMYAETKNIHKRLDVMDKKFDQIDNEAGEQWGRLRTVEENRTNCRQAMDEKLRGMKIWSGIVTGVQAGITFLWLLLLKSMGLGPKS